MNLFSKVFLSFLIGASLISLSSCTEESPIPNHLEQNIGEADVSIEYISLEEGKRRIAKIHEQRLGKIEATSKSFGIDPARPDYLNFSTSDIKNGRQMSFLAYGNKTGAKLIIQASDRAITSSSIHYASRYNITNTISLPTNQCALIKVTRQDSNKSYAVGYVYQDASNNVYNTGVVIKE